MPSLHGRYSKSLSSLLEDNGPGDSKMEGLCSILKTNTNQQLDKADTTATVALLQRMLSRKQGIAETTASSGSRDETAANANSSVGDTHASADITASVETWDGTFGSKSTSRPEETMSTPNLRQAHPPPPRQANDRQSPPQLQHGTTTAQGKDGSLIQIAGALVAFLGNQLDEQTKTITEQRQQLSERSNHIPGGSDDLLVNLYKSQANQQALLADKIRKLEAAQPPAAPVGDGSEKSGDGAAQIPATGAEINPIPAAGNTNRVDDAGADPAPAAENCHRRHGDHKRRQGERGQKEREQNPAPATGNRSGTDSDTSICESRSAKRRRQRQNQHARAQAGSTNANAGSTNAKAGTAAEAKNSGLQHAKTGGGRSDAPTDDRAKEEGAASDNGDLDENDDDYRGDFHITIGFSYWL